VLNRAARIRDIWRELDRRDGIAALVALLARKSLVTKAEVPEEIKALQAKTPKGR